MIEVAEGKISHQEAIQKIEQHRDSRFDKAIDDVSRLVDKGLISEAQARILVLAERKAAGLLLTEGAGEGTPSPNSGGFDQFYEEG